MHDNNNNVVVVDSDVDGDRTGRDAGEEKAVERCTSAKIKKSESRCGGFLQWHSTWRSLLFPHASINAQTFFNWLGITISPGVAGFWFLNLGSRVQAALSPGQWTPQYASQGSPGPM